ncbi:MAG: ABC transporter substrate-binding protein [Rhodopila sp.]
MRLSRLAAALLSSVVALTPALFSTGASAETRGVSPNEIVIGTYTDLSGVTAMWGVNNSNSWHMVFDEVNAEGGINGRKIKYIVEDNQYQVPRSVQAANKLINRDGVFIMVANGGTPMNNAVMPDQLAKGVANVFPLTSARSMYEPLHHLKFGLGSSYYDQIRSGVKYFVENKGKKQVCMIRQDTDFVRDIGDGVKDQLKADKMEVSAETLHKPTDTDFSAPVARLRDANCDLVVIGGIVRDTVQIISAIRKTGWNVDLLGQAASYDDAVATVPGGVTEGFYSMAPMLFVAESSDDPKVKAFAEKYEKLYGKKPNFAAQVGYTGAQVVVLALKNGGKDLTTDSFVSGMESVKDYHDIFGSPTISFSPTKHQGSNESFLCVIKDGKWVTAEPTPMGY